MTARLFRLTPANGYRDLGVPPGDDPNWPFLLSAGERRSFTANTILRDPAWRKRDPDGALRLAPIDAERLGLSDGDNARLTTARTIAMAPEPSDRSVMKDRSILILSKEKRCNELRLE